MVKLAVNLAAKHLVTTALKVQRGSWSVSSVGFLVVVEFEY